MRTTYCLFLLIAALGLSGCEAVFTQQPVGDELVKLDPEVWQGTWLSDEIVVLTTVLDADKGLLQAAWVERAADGARFESVTGSVRRTGDMLFLNMQHGQFEDQAAGGASANETTEGPPDVPEFYWARIENDGHRAVFWWPDVAQITVAVNEGKLPGTIKQDKDVLLGALDATQLALINAPANNLLKWSQPVTFIRIGD